MITLRPATTADIPTLLVFEQGVIAAERPHDPTLGADPIHYYDLGKLIASPDSELLVAVDGDRLVGSGYARIDPSEPWLAHRQHAYIGFIYVVPSHRGHRISRMVLDALADWARGRGLSELRLEVYDGNTSAITAYERAGFSRHMLEMRKPTV